MQILAHVQDVSNVSDDQLEHADDHNEFVSHRLRVRRHHLQVFYLPVGHQSERHIILVAVDQVFRISNQRLVGSFYSTTKLSFVYIIYLCAHFLGTETFEVTLLPALFTTYKNVTKYKVQLQISIDKNITGLSSMVVALNQLPTGGFCTLDLLAGVALHTYFTITCKNWYDPDGKITRYEYYCKMIGLFVCLLLLFS